MSEILLDIDYFTSSNSTYLNYVYFTNNRKSSTTIKAPFRPYFFIKKSDVERIPKEVLHYIDIEEVDAVTREGEKVVKISVSTPPMVRRVREILEKNNISTYEADIPYVRRVMIDKDLRVKSLEKIASFDIEVDASEGFPDVTKGDRRILSISIYSPDEEIFLCYEDDEQILREFSKLLDKFEVFVGWNSAAFDYPYIKKRAEVLGVLIPERYFQHIDLMGIYMTFFKREEKNFKLSEVAKKVLGEDVPLGALVDFEKPGGIQKLTEFAKSNKDLLYYYNMGQAKAVYMIAERTGILQTYIVQHQISSLLPWHYEIPREQIAAKKYLSYNKIVENLVLKKALKRSPRVVYPSKSSRDDSVFEEDSSNHESKYEGAIVFDPAAGYWSNVVLLDFANMYPRVIRTFNVSYETWKPVCEESDILAKHGCFKLNPVGLLPELLADLESWRKMAKQMMELYPPGTVDRTIWSARQFAFKLILVSSYGVAGFEKSRLYQLEIAENITSYTRDLITKSKDLLEKHGWKVLYGDTDSIFIYAPEFKDYSSAHLSKIVLEELLPWLNEEIKKYIITRYRVPKDRVVIEFKADRIFKKLKLLSVKKRYYGLVSWEEKTLDQPYLLVKGLEARRGDWPEIVAEIQSILMPLDLEEKCEDFIKVLEDYRKKLFNNEIDIENLMIRKSLTKDVRKYKHDAPHKRAALLYEKAGFKPRTGDKIEYIYLDPEIVINIPGIKLTKTQLDKFWKKYILPIVERLETKCMQRTDLLRYIK